jgi:hypothetical protein
MHISTCIYMFKKECICLLLRMVDYNNRCTYVSILFKDGKIYISKNKGDKGLE